MEDELYKTSEDYLQKKYLAVIERENTITSCLHLARRFIHSENQYRYTCENHEPEGCPKSKNQGMPGMGCFTVPRSFNLNDDNNDEGDFREK
jgi:hypothetical protein